MIFNWRRPQQFGLSYFELGGFVHNGTLQRRQRSEDSRGSFYANRAGNESVQFANVFLALLHRLPAGSWKLGVNGADDKESEKQVGGRLSLMRPVTNARENSLL